MMEKAHARFGDGCQRCVQLPWELVNDYRDGGELGRKSALARAALLRRPRQGRPSSSHTGHESGLTRRGVVYEYIRTHPGAHVRGMANDLSIATGDLQYHLSWLEKNGYVETRKNGFYRFVFASKIFDERQETMLGTLSQGTPREILLSLLEDEGMTQGRLAKSLRHSQPTISWHMERLTAQGLVSKSRTGKGIAYEVIADHAELLRFVKEYHPAVWKKWQSRLPTTAVVPGKENEEGKIPRMGLVRPALVELIRRS